MIGYKRMRMEHIRVDDGAATSISFELVEDVIQLKEVIVTPGHFAMMQKDLTVKQTLKPEDIRSVSQIGEDVYRAVTRLPGLAGNDYSSKFTVRGGEQEEVLVLLNGLELYDPFHLKDFTGAISVIDVEAIGGIDLITGAFPAEYGDKLSGVFNIKTTSPSLERRRTSAALSFMNVRFLSEGSFVKGKGQWLVLARRGYIDLVLKLIGENDNLSPFYYDVLSKFQYQFNSKQALAFHVLKADDDLDFEEGDRATTGYGNTYGWLTWYANWHPKLFTQTVLSIGRVDQNRRGTDVDSSDGSLEADVTDKRGFDFYGLKQDWSYDLSNRFLLKWGLDAKRLLASYDYFNRDQITEIVDGNIVTRFDTTQIRLNPSDTEVRLYFGNRLRIVKPLTVELGLRYDYASWTDDKKISPRFNLALALAKTTTVRLGWGKFYQSQGIHELDVQDGDNVFYPAELAEHRVIGLEHGFGNGVHLRVEAYQKKLLELRPRYQNLSGSLEFFPEIEEDRIRLQPENGESKGVEVFVKKDTGGKFSWWQVTVSRLRRRRSMAGPSPKISISATQFISIPTFVPIVSGASIWRGNITAAGLTPSSPLSASRCRAGSSSQGFMAR